MCGAPLLRRLVGCRAPVPGHLHSPACADQPKVEGVPTGMRPIFGVPSTGQASTAQALRAVAPVWRRCWRSKQSSSYRSWTPWTASPSTGVLQICLGWAAAPPRPRAWLSHYYRLSLRRRPLLLLVCMPPVCLAFVSSPLPHSLHTSCRSCPLSF